MKIKKINITEIEEDLFFKKSNLKKHFKYFKVAKELFEEDYYEDLSTQAIILYALFRDRMELSAKNGWFDEKGRVYINFSNNSIIKYFNGKRGFKTKKKIIDLKKELENKKLIFQVRQFLGNANKIYVLKTLKDDELKWYQKEHSKSSEKGNSKSSETGNSKSGEKGNTNETNKSDTNYNKTEFNDINSVLEEQIINFPQCVAKIESLLGNFLNRVDIERLQEQVSRTGQSLSLVLHAYKMCIEKNSPKNSSYITAILNNWYNDYKIKTVEDLIKVENQKKENKFKRDFSKSKRYIEEKDILTKEEKEEKLKVNNDKVIQLLENY